MYMRVVAINGSPRGRSSATAALLGAFLGGAGEGGAEIEQIILSELRIGQCRGCYSCWTVNPGHCAIEDDMGAILPQLMGADVLVLGTPLYFNNVSGTLKAFIDRMTATGGNPHSRELRSGSGSLVMVSNCGFADRGQFAALSLWAQAMSRLLGLALAAEIYAPRGKFLAEVAPGEAARAYLAAAKDAGFELVSAGFLSAATRTALERCPG
jgi:NAD(P)H-dependent FMN reductase